jgi:hypothetical protein
VPETPIARWRYDDVDYGVAAMDEGGGILVVVVAAVGPAGRERSAHAYRLRNAGEIAHQLVRWNAATDEERAREAERLLAVTP